MSPTMQTEFIQTNGLLFEVDTMGQGDKLALLLHGFPESSYSWRHQMPLLADMGYHVWAPNLRGYGKSSRPVQVSDYAMDHLVADVVGLINAAKPKSVVLIAHDWGGAVAWEVVIRHPELIDKFIPMNIPHPALFMKKMFTSRQFFRSWYMFFFQLPWFPEWYLRRFDAEAISAAFTDMAVRKHMFPKEVTNVYRKAALEPGALTAMLNWYRAMFRTIPSKKVRDGMHRLIKTPTLHIWGEADTALGKDLTYGTERLVANYTLRYLPKVSHWVQQEAPDMVNAMMQAWLEGKTVPLADDL